MNAAAAVLAMKPPARAERGQRETADRLISALRGEEFVLYAQPIVAAAPENDRPAAQEILVRFLEEEEKLLPPGSFFPVLESYGLLTYLDRWVVNRTIRWLRRRRPGEIVPCSAINLSTDTLRDATFASFVARQVHSGGVPPSAIAFEIPWADAVAHKERALALAAAIRSLGCGLSLTSYEDQSGSPAVLRAFTPDCVKISGDLIGGMDRDPMLAAIVEGIGNRCREMGIRTVAEHVEQPETLALARDAGIDYVQGFLVGRPMPLG